MDTQRPTKFFQVSSVGAVQGPVGMDVGIWLQFDTDQGELRLKLSHEDAIKLEDMLNEEDSVATPPRKLVANTADALFQLAAEFARKQDTVIAERLESHADDLRLAARRMPPDD